MSGAVSSYDTTAQADRKPTVGIAVETRRSENVLNFELPPAALVRYGYDDPWKLQVVEV